MIVRKVIIGYDYVIRLTIEAEPTPSPMRKRPTTICAMVKEEAWIMAPRVKRIDANQIAGRLPYLSPVTPAMIDPTRAPAAHMAVINSLFESVMGLLSRSEPITTSTPEMTPVSYPGIYVSTVESSSMSSLLLHQIACHQWR